MKNNNECDKCGRMTADHLVENNIIEKPCMCGKGYDKQIKEKFDELTIRLCKEYNAILADGKEYELEPTIHANEPENCGNCDGSGVESDGEECSGSQHDEEDLACISASVKDSEEGTTLRDDTVFSTEDNAREFAVGFPKTYWIASLRHGDNDWGTAIQISFNAITINRAGYVILVEKKCKHENVTGFVAGVVEYDIVRDDDSEILYDFKYRKNNSESADFRAGEYTCDECNEKVKYEDLE